SSGRNYLHRSRLSAEMRAAINVFGDRLEKPGKERLTLTGTLSHGDGSQSLPIRLVTEFPRRMRLEVQHGNQTHVIGFDGRNGWKKGSALTKQDQDIIESLIYDSADHFFIGQADGLALQPLGKRFRDDDGSNPNYSGPFYDIYQLSDKVVVGTSGRIQL